MPKLQRIITLTIVLALATPANAKQSLLKEALRQWRGAKSEVSLTERAIVSRFNSSWRASLSKAFQKELPTVRTLDDLYGLHPRVQKKVKQLLENEAFPGIKPKTYELVFELPAAQRESFELLLRQFNQSAMKTPHSASRFHEIAKAEVEIRSLSDTPLIQKGCKNLSDPEALHQLARVTHRVKAQIRPGMNLSSEQMSEILVNAFYRVFKGNKKVLWRDRICPLVRVCKVIDERWAKACFAHSH